MQEVLALQLKREPWLSPEEESWWIVTSVKDGATGAIGIDTKSLYATTLIDCICTVSDYGDGPLFEMATPVGGSTVVSPTNVAFAKQLLLVMYDDPKEAYYDRDQAVLDASHN